MGVRGTGGDGELVFHGYKVSIWENENVLKLDHSDDCTTT